MGVYLSAPITEKVSGDKQCEGFVYGASSMQGWRITQEDAHNCIPKFDVDSNTSFFAVYDGHGGPEVAQYCERHFPDFVTNLIKSPDAPKDLSALIKAAFLAFDATLTDDDVIKELKELAGKDDEADEEEEVDPVGRTETDRLKEEATMPLDQVLAQYESSQPGQDNKSFQSPALRGKKGPGGEGEPSQAAQNGTDQPGSSSSSSSSSCPQQPSSSSAEAAASSSSSTSSSSSSSVQQVDSSSSVPNGKSKSSESVGSDEAVKESEAEASSTSNNNNVDKAQGGSSSKDESGGSGSSSSSAAKPGDSSGSRDSKLRAKAGMALQADSSDDDDDDDDDEEDEEDMWEDMSDDDDEEDEEEEEEEENDENVPMMDMTNEEPGSDSGCTACVLLMQGKKLIVANAGDSRCVLSRGGTALELSFDHKPEDQPERDRIEKAGGKVTADGRVNGGLNLSRAIGDHVYKRNTELPAKDQMITALPDIETAELSERDQFIVIACDGIWNSMSSQEVVDYVGKRLQDPEKRSKPSLICEELFDNCLAPDNYGDGTGCDNMTCVIIVFDSYVPNDAPSTEKEASKTENSTADKDQPDSSSDSASSKETPASANEETSNLVTGSMKRCGEEVEGADHKRTKMEKEVV